MKTNLEFHAIKDIIDHLYKEQVITALEHGEAIKKLLASYDISKTLTNKRA
jgi:hypothetical protein